MFEFDRIPSAVKCALGERGIDLDSVRIAAYADRTREHKKADIYLFATATKLILLGGAFSDGHVSGEIKNADLHTNWRTDLYEVYPLDELCGFRVEELLSSGRLTATQKAEGETESRPLLLVAFTNFCKDSMFLFAKYAERLCAGEEIEIDPKDDPSSKSCPKCGMRYPDPNRPICPHCMDKAKLFSRFSVFLLRYRGYLILSVISLVVLTAMSILTPYLSSGFFYDEVIYGTGPFAGALLLVLGLIVATRILKLLSAMVNDLFTSYIAAKMTYDLKKTIFLAIERLSLSFFTSRQTGSLMTQINEDSNIIYDFVGNKIPYLIVNVVQILVLIVLLFIINPILAAFSLLTAPIFVLIVRWIYQKAKPMHARRHIGSKKLNSLLSDVFSGMRVVKAFSKEDEEIRRFGNRNEALATGELKVAMFGNFVWPVAHQILYLGNIIAWGLGGWMVITNSFDLSYGMLLTFITYMNMIFSPLTFFVDFFDKMANAVNAMQRLYEILEAQPEVSEKENALSPENLSGSVEFDRVTFSYQKGKKIIDDVSFEVPDGRILGIVGHTGAGKSTLANLLMRMYDTEDGEIRIGGYPVKDLTLSTIYKNVAIVSQETYLFMGTILENIRYAKPEADFDEVIAASKCAGAHDFIMKLPDEYDTRIGFGYKDLSGGERQRISIARAILMNPKILILDEATAAMDTGTERRIQEALSVLTQGKTTIMIAHRLSTLRDADELIVIEHGRVAERGTHKSLLENEDGIYKKLFTLQEEALKSAGISE